MRVLLGAIENIAVEAGRLIVERRARGAAWSLKADGSPVTMADQLAEGLILTRLERLFGEVPVVAEERAAAIGFPSFSGRRYFLVDALDGTKELIKGSADFTVNIALVEDGVPTLGVVVAPLRGELYSGHGGRAERALIGPDGVIRERAAIRTRTPGDRLDAVVSVSHPSAATQALLDRLAIASRLSIGSSLKFCLVARGAADIYPRLSPTSQWDTAAGDAILRNAGGCVLTLDGAPLAYEPAPAGAEGAYVNGAFVAFGGGAGLLRELLRC
jgi:3'(2'), 5'-bisphosphate nucleotidase